MGAKQSEAEKWRRQKREGKREQRRRKQWEGNEGKWQWKENNLTEKNGGGKNGRGIVGGMKREQSEDCTLFTCCTQNVG